MGFFKNLLGGLRWLNPEEIKAFDRVIITGDYSEESITTGVEIIKRATAVEILALTPVTGLAFGFAGDGANNANTVYLYRGGAWAAFDGT